MINAGFNILPLKLAGYIAVHFKAVSSKDWVLLLVIWSKPNDLHLQSYYLLRSIHLMFYTKPDFCSMYDFLSHGIYLSQQSFLIATGNSQLFADAGYDAFCFRVVGAFSALEIKRFGFLIMFLLLLGICWVSCIMERKCMRAEWSKSCYMTAMPQISCALSVTALLIADIGFIASDLKLYFGSPTMLKDVDFHLFKRVFYWKHQDIKWRSSVNTLHSHRRKAVIKLEIYAMVSSL